MSDPGTPTLRRTMGAWDVVLFLVAAVSGLRWIATAAVAGPSSLVVWVGAFVTFFIPLAVTVIALAARFPDEGGLYVWVKRAFGDFAGFMAGWMYWTSNLVYYPALLYFSAGNALFIAPSGAPSLAASAPYYMAASLVLLLLALALNVVGLGVGKWLHNAGGVGSWLPILLLLGLAGLVWARFGPATPINAETLVPHFGLKDVLFWSTITFGFGGVEAASFMSEEIRDAKRTIPRAIIGAGAIITGIYILGTAAVIVALPPGEATSLQGITQAISRTAERVGLPALGPLAALLITIGNVGGVGAWLAASARLPFVAGVDRALPPAFGRLHPRWGTPHIALYVQAAGAALFAILGQAGSSVQAAYDALVGIGVISYFIPYLMMFAAVMKLVPKPGIRALAALGSLVTAVSIVLAALPTEGTENPTLAVVKVVGSSVALVLVGWLLFARAQRRRAD